MAHHMAKRITSRSLGYIICIVISCITQWILELPSRLWFICCDLCCDSSCYEIKMGLLHIVKKNQGCFPHM